MPADTLTLTIPAGTLGPLRQALQLAHADVSDGLRDYGQKDCLDCGLGDDGPCDVHADDDEFVDAINDLLAALPDKAVAA